jgi:hypothetical protein
MVLHAGRSQGRAIAARWAPGREFSVAWPACACAKGVPKMPVGSFVYTNKMPGFITDSNVSLDVFDSEEANGR